MSALRVLGSLVRLAPRRVPIILTATASLRSAWRAAARERVATAPPAAFRFICWKLTRRRWHGGRKTDRFGGDATGLEVFGDSQSAKIDSVARQRLPTPLVLRRDAFSYPFWGRLRYN